MLLDGKTCHPVDRIGHDVGALRKICHEHAFRVSRVTVLRFYFGQGEWMPDDGHAHRIGCALPGKVVRRGAYATKAKYHVATRHAGLECGGNLLGDVA